MKTTIEPFQRKPWYLITGIIIGLVIGLVFAWWVFPVEYVDTPPSSLREDIKGNYRVMIALSYAVNQDLARAKIRLHLLDGNDNKPGVPTIDVIPTSVYLLGVQAQQSLAEGRVETEAQALGLLAAVFGQKPTQTITAVPSSSPSPMSRSATPSVQQKITSTQTASHGILSNATASITPKPSTPAYQPLPSRTPSLTPPALFSLQSRKLICDPALHKPMLQIQVSDTEGVPLSGVRAVIKWQGGQDTFITGLKTEFGQGFADFTLKPTLRYSLLVGEGGESVGDIKVEECETSRKEQYGGIWLLTYRQLP